MTCNELVCTNLVEIRIPKKFSVCRMKTQIENFFGILISTVYIIYIIYTDDTPLSKLCSTVFSLSQGHSLFRPDFRCTKIAKYKRTIQLSPSRGTLPFLYKTAFHCRRVGYNVWDVFYGWLVLLTVFNTAFNNNSAILWQSVLLVEETGVSEENYRPFGSN